MTQPPAAPQDVSRRRFLTQAGVALAAPLLGSALAAPSPANAVARRSARSQRRPNILFVFTDQERYLDRLPEGFELPGHARLAARGVSFRNHYCPAVMCTSSRAVLLTGLQTPDNRMFENADMPYVKALAPEVPTIGHMLRRAGYYTAYKGKWHLNADFDTEAPTHLFTREMEAYGFSDFVWPGDVLTHTLGGYQHDHMIAGSAISWMRDQGQRLSDAGRPWSLFVSLVNPHDIMYFNTDQPGEAVQDNGRLLMQAARAPRHPLYRDQWSLPLSASWREPMDAPGRPKAHGEFLRAWGHTLGSVPPEAARWERFNDFYFNSLRAVDAQLVRMLDELEALGLAENTVVVFTSDHGEMGGAHGLRGKGPFAYQEAIHLPLLITHPDVRGGQDCRALTSHIDLVPTLLALAGVDAGQAAELAGRALPGKDVSGVLQQPASADLHAVRDAVLFTYSGLATNDSELIRRVAEAKAAGQDLRSAVKASGYRPDMTKRGSLRTVFDGRYKLTRYFAPVQRNRPRTLEELYRDNDVELFDLSADPGELHNLAANPAGHEALVLAMSDKLEAVIAAEIGVDDGREMPQIDGIDWRIERMDL